MDSPRAVLEDYVRAGKLMQVATLAENGYPAVCHVWYSSRFSPDRLYFISRRDRDHSVNIRRNPNVAGGIVAIALSGLGQTVSGVSFKGHARELGTESGPELDRFIERWPNAGKSISIMRIANDDTFSRLYEISVGEWVLFDEETFPESPRHQIDGEP